MDSTLRDRWVTALRSGEYAQGKGCLRTVAESYCCLGVLCEIAVTDGVIPPPTVRTNQRQREDGSTASYAYGADGTFGTVAFLKSFAEIADVIEAGG